MSMFRSDTSTPDPVGGDASAAVLHWVDGAWSALRFTPGHGITITAADRLTDDQVEPWCTQSGCGLVRVVLPAASVLARTTALGQGDAVELEHALIDLTSSQFGDGTPLHRMGAMVLPEGVGDAGHVGVTTAWPEHTAVRLPPNMDEILCVPDVAGLLSILGEQRPDMPLFWVDPADSSVAMVIAGMGHVAVRSTRANLGTNPGEAVRRIALEAAVNAGWSADQARSLSSHVHIDGADTPHLGLGPSVMESFRARCNGALPDDLDRFGIAMACALATTDDFATLTLMRPALPEVEPTFADRMQDTLGQRSMAFKLVAIFLLGLLMGPLAFNAVRLGLLSIAHGNIDEAVMTAAVSEQRNMLYRQLGSGSIPVTKLLADIGAATPLGIRLDTIRMGAGEPLRITGAATRYRGLMPADLIAEMKELLGRNGVFRNVAVEWGPRSNMNQRDFSLTAVIGRAPHRPDYADEQDYAAWTYQQRKHDLPMTADGGPSPRASLSEGWVPDQPSGGAGSARVPTGGGINGGLPAGSGATTSANVPGGPLPLPAGGTGQPGNGDPIRPGATGPNRPDRPISGVTAGDSGSLSVAGDGFKAGDASAESRGVIPQILSNEQIASLGKAETHARINEVSKARGHNKNPEVEAELADYFMRLFDHLRSLDAKGKATP